VDQESLETQIATLRPQLHRYCARMTGSVIDGEDILQDALVKAVEALPRTAVVTNPSGWLFRLAHNTALDYLRRKSRLELTPAEVLENIVDPDDELAERQITAAGLRTFMRLPVFQRGTVILKDVLGYSVSEICAIIDATEPAVKSALQRGRGRLRKIACEPEEAPAPTLTEPERRRLATYVDLFNARDFDAVRRMLADDVRLDLVNRLQIQGEKVGEYFDRYAAEHHWHLVPGSVDGRAAILVLDPNDLAGAPRYFMLLEWRGEKIARIRDFLFAAHVMEVAEYERA